jgi:hypothetical protein
MTPQPLRGGVACDTRNLPESGMSHAAVYAAIFEEDASDRRGRDLSEQ